jgi:hypothetical protein
VLLRICEKTIDLFVKKIQYLWKRKKAGKLKFNNRFQKLVGCQTNFDNFVKLPSVFLSLNFKDLDKQKVLQYDTF